MSSSLTNKQWVIIILVNIVVSAITTLIIVRALTNQPLSKGAGINAPVEQLAPQAVQPTLAPLPTLTVQGALVVATPLSSPTPKPAATPATKPTATGSAAATTTAKAVTPAPVSATGKTVSVTISNVLYPGQRQREVVVIVNLGSEVPLKSWTLTATNGISYTFGNVTLFKDSFISLHTTNGADVTTDLFLNRLEPAWQPGDLITLSSGSQVMATYTVK